METARFVPTNKVRIVTAAALFDGHDASINIMRRMLQAGGAEVVHLGHNRSVADVVAAIIEEDAQAVAVSSYQGGHMEYFRYMRQLLDAAGSTHVKIFGGGGAQKLPEVVKQFEEKGMRDQVDSWVRTGPNKPVERRQIEDAFGQRELEDIARSKGIDRDQLADVLAKYIPRIIDELTPSGQMPARR